MTSEKLALLDEGWRGAEIRDDRRERVAAALQRALTNRARIQPVTSAMGVPWALVAATQELEASGSMSRHPANGDKLTHRTVNVPAGLPKHGTPPFDWENVAEEELSSLVKFGEDGWTVPKMMDAAETFNGLGYRKRGKRSPYLFACTTLEQAGKYVADHVYDPHAWSDQVGCVALWKAMEAEGLDLLEV